MNDLAIREVKFFKASSELKKPIADSTHSLTEISFIVLRIQLENGVIGESYLLSFQYSPNAIIGALKDIVPLIKGFKAFETGMVYQKLENLFEYFGNQGLLRWVQSAINIAMWDAWGKVQGQPVQKLLGVTKKNVNIYGSGGWLSYSIDELIQEVTDYADRGFKAVKIKVGSPKVSTDLNRLREIREAVGDKVDIMMDANQGMDLPSAIKLAQNARDLNIHWFEEPVHHQDFQAYQILKNQTGISLAMGEREFDTLPLRELVTRNALDIWQPDILRIGGVEAWRESAALAHSFHLPVLPHYYKDYDVPLLCTIPNGVGAESFDWIDPLIDNPMVIQDGYAKPHDLPGWGFSFIDDRLTEIK
ncbi:mandelate racemase/muconate lactonizing enzyme family protein [Echinicola strongylocentroti]|uniref:Mandelate racemase/muconate lactonizing enzyme family protein n=1 Tax=Echinicola strongylocentroti TaxID=1795355 RepID=A0A2Z4IFD7_9BACT|nr:mandelate racemase/muconate lactonizing enzyme family protein [Echinicola strongylocentroti]AWW29595.1 mandelate racemase/muconate lactonizing enzyme family protein [Echinicola strongylocentroti]